MAMDSIIQRRLLYSWGGRFASECPADLERNRWTDLERNRWPFCLGIRTCAGQWCQERCLLLLYLQCPGSGEG